MGPKLDKDLVREFSFVHEGGVALTSSAAGRIDRGKFRTTLLP